MISGLADCESKADIAIRMLAEQGALQLQNSARENRKWTDRTGHARQRLTGYVGKIPEGYRITLAHGVDYGIWLELAHEKRFSIIPRTIEYVGTFEIMPGFQRLIERLNG
jgi:hypothetical protein